MDIDMIEDWIHDQLAEERNKEQAVATDKDRAWSKGRQYAFIEILSMIESAEESALEEVRCPR